MTTYARITDKQNMVRDMYSKAVLNTDASVVKKHEQRLKLLEKEQAREAEINKLKSELSEIKTLLKQLLNK